MILLDCFQVILRKLSPDRKLHESWIIAECSPWHMCSMSISYTQPFLLTIRQRKFVSDVTRFSVYHMVTVIKRSHSSFHSSLPTSCIDQSRRHCRGDNRRSLGMVSRLWGTEKCLCDTTHHHFMSSPLLISKHHT